MSGFSLFAGALSQAASDTMKGLREGEAARLQEEENARKNRAQQISEFFVPQQYKTQELLNTQTAQNMDLAQRRMAIEQAVEDRARRMFGPQYRSAEAGATTAEVGADYVRREKESQLSIAEAQLKELEEKVRSSKETSPALAEHYTAAAAQARAAAAKLRQEVAQDEIDRRERDKASILLFNAVRSGNWNDVGGVLSMYGQHFTKPDAFTNWMDAMLRVQAAKEGREGLTPVANNAIYQNIRAYGAKQADDTVKTILGPAAAAEGGQTLLDMNAWFEKYYRAMEARKQQAITPGLSIPAEDFVIPKMPESVKQKIAEDKRRFAWLRSPTNARVILDAAEPFLMAGMEWNQALALGAQMLTTNPGAVTPSTPTVNPETTTGGGTNVPPRSRPPQGTSGEVVGPPTVSAGPPTVPTPAPALPPRVGDRQAGVDALIRKYYGTPGTPTFLSPHVTRYMLQGLDNGAEMIKYAEDAYDRGER